MLYGFVHDDERRCFEVLLGSHGVGPALALGIMAVLSPASLSTAVLEDDLDTLCTVPGVGRKTAARLLIELKSRLDLPDLSLGAQRHVGRRRRQQPHVTVRGAGRADRARLRPRGDPWCARRPARRCGGGRDVATGVARAGQPVSPRARREVLATADEDAGSDPDARLVAPVVASGGEEVEEAGLRPRSLCRVRRSGPAGRAPRHRAPGGAPATAAGRPSALRRAPGTGQDVPGRDRGHRNGRRSAHHLGPGADPGRRPGRAAHRPPGRRRPLHRRDPSPAPLGRGDALLGHGGRQARHPDRQGADGALHPPRPPPLHAGRRHHPHRPGVGPVARPFRLRRAGSTSTLRSTCRPSSSGRPGSWTWRSTEEGSTRISERSRGHASCGQPPPAPGARLRRGAGRRLHQRLHGGRGPRPLRGGRARPGQGGPGHPRDVVRAASGASRSG